MGIAIRLKEVSFKYDGAKENVLENINLHRGIRRNRAFVGRFR